MTRIYTAAGMSLDGYIAGPDETGLVHLFSRYNYGELEMSTTHPELTSRVTPVNAGYLAIS